MLTFHFFWFILYRMAGRLDQVILLMCSIFEGLCEIKIVPPKS